VTFFTNTICFFSLVFRDYLYSVFFFFIRIWTGRYRVSLIADLAVFFAAQFQALFCNFLFSSQTAYALRLSLFRVFSPLVVNRPKSWMISPCLFFQPEWLIRSTSIPPRIGSLLFPCGTDLFCLKLGQRVPFAAFFAAVLSPHFRSP